MIYLSHFEFPDILKEELFINNVQRTCYDTFYPFMVVSMHGLRMLDFAPVTILYGGNGSGKTTALNVIAEKLKLQRGSLYNRSNFFEDYTDMCTYEVEREVPEHSRIITSDDVFDFMLDLRGFNEGIDKKREELVLDYKKIRKDGFKWHSMEDFEDLKNANMIRTKSKSAYIRANLPDTIREHSNGESAFMYFSEKIQENGLYLLDEPENSLSPERQQELLQFLEDSARFFGCQFVIATHSPFLLSMRGAKIYDLDENPVDVKRWTELDNVRAYYQFFKKHEGEFL